MSSHQPVQAKDQLEPLISLMRGLGTRTVLYQQNVAASLGLYNNDLKSVDILRETGPITAGELSKITGMATGSITALIDRLEKAGYVRRQNDPSDRRRVIIVPEYEYKEEVAGIYRPLHSEEELKVITHYIGKASGILEEQIRSLSAARGKSSS